MIPRDLKAIIDGETTNCWQSVDDVIASVVEAYRQGRRWHVVASSGGQQRRELRPREAAALTAAITKELQ